MDVAQLLYRAGKKDLALKVLSSVSDLDLENEEVYKLLGYKLKEMNQYAKELWVFRKVKEWRPFDPQSFRDYALAAQDNRNHQEALDNLYKILTKTYSPELANRDDGIEDRKGKSWSFRIRKIRIHLTGTASLLASLSFKRKVMKVL